MNPDEFVSEVIDRYERSRTPLWQHSKIKRGESRSISSEVEDLLAFYLASRLPSLDEVFINQPMTVAGQPRFKPDLVFCRDKQIGALLDVKIDLGWKRKEFESMLQDTDAHIQALRGQMCSFRVKDGSRIGGMNLPVSQSAKYFFVILSDCNITPALCSRFEKCALALNNTKLLVLTRDLHPNQPCYSKQQILERIKICNSAFERMEHDIEQALAAVG
jgi:hypothetical protein